MQFQWRPYRRRFRQPLTTAHGVWAVREGIILRAQTASGRISWGEIAPIPWFGTETIADAIANCQKLAENPALSIEDPCPATQFGWETLRGHLCPSSSIQPAPTISDCSWLLPSGSGALADWSIGWGKGASTFKWKIGQEDLVQEQTLLSQLLEELPAPARLRLDANGGLTLSQARQWLQFLQNYPQVEFLEQPLPPTQFENLQTLEKDYSTRIALDESVATLEQLRACYEAGWRGIFVIKAPLLGSPAKFREFARAKSLDLVFSSALEGPVARSVSLTLAQELGSRRALGFGVNHWFAEDEQTWWRSLQQTFLPH
ncbi:MAG: o-succinylbenzoate synthase [Cyanobacteria bacterium P01_H01_bin.15]